MRVLVVDIGGTNIKIRATGQERSQKIPSGPSMTPDEMMRCIRDISCYWKYDLVSIGYPGRTFRGIPVEEPANLAQRRKGIDFESAFSRPVRLINDATMQALGSYKKGKMLFLGLGTGLGSAFVVDGILAPTELGHLPYRQGTFEDYVGRRALHENGIRRWRRDVADVIARLIAALQPDDVVIGGGNAKELEILPPGCRLGNNANAIAGGFLLWENEQAATCRLCTTALPNHLKPKRRFAA